MANDRGEALDPLALPGFADWDQLGLTSIRELSGGYQSRVFSARSIEGRVVVKLTDERSVDSDRFEHRLEMLVALGRVNDEAVGPQLRNGTYFDRLGGWLAVVYPFIDGRAPNLDRASDVAMMGRTLAGLHRSMATLPTFGLPAPAALEVVKGVRPGLPSRRTQLIHGDFAAANLRLQAGKLRVFDFDDCGCGPVEFDVGNSLYMVLFDATINKNRAGYDRFRHRFVGSYRTESREPVDDDLLDTMIDRRRAALRHWLDNLDEAPIGIKTSSPEWRKTLRSFADPS